MQTTLNNPCPQHPQEQLSRFCKSCGAILCSVCSGKHAHEKKVVIETIEEDFFDNFIFEKHLGAGANGNVFKVRSLTEKKPYALKVIENVKELCEASQEVQLMANLQHANIIQYGSSQWIKKKEIL